jgi:phospholipid/cholesterol/gamma-HCH transport system substrate-binding protein
MITTEQKFRLSVFATASLALLLLILALLIAPKLKSRGSPYLIFFKGASVNGLLVGAPVKYQGVEVGTVAGIAVRPDDLASIRVELEISKSFPVKTDMSATMTFAGITGSKFIELAGGTNEAPGLAPGGEIPMARGLGEKAEDILANIDRAVRNINDVLGPENQTRISAFLENTEKSAAVVSGVLQAKKESLGNAITHIEKAALEFGAVTGDLRRIASDLGGLTSKLDAKAAEALDNFNKRFSDAEMGKVLGNLEALIGTASSSLLKIENVLLVQQTGLGTTVDSLGEAIENLSKFLRELMEDPTLFLRSRKVKK